MKPNKISISDLKENPNNPRYIKGYKFEKLVKSIKEFPEMLKLRPIVVDENNVILGGNMRYKASVEAGLKTVYVIQADDFTEQQKKEFIIKDNSNFGEWDWDLLANEWNNDELKEWGLDVVSLEENFDNEEMFESDDTDTKDEVIINLKMPYYQYEEIDQEFQSFIKKYPNIVCRIQN
jgi:ParB-like chromosome segregation protein Spo0J